MISGIAAGAALAGYDLAVAGAPSGFSALAIAVAAVLAFDLSLGLAVGLLQAVLIRGWADGDRFSRAVRKVRGAAVSLVKVASPEAESKRLGMVGSILLLSGLAGILIYRSAINVAPRVEIHDNWAAELAASTVAQLVVIVLAAPVVSALFSRLLRPLVQRFSRYLRLRNVLLLMAGLCVVAAGIFWSPLQTLARALDLSFVGSIGLFIVLDLLCLVGGWMWLHRVVRTRPRRWAVGLLGLVLGCWVVVLSPLGNHPGAVQLFRGQAPLTGALVRLADAATDWDDDGFSAFFGGGDCAPHDPARGPAALEKPNNGIDEDCFEGDLKGSREMLKPKPVALKEALIPKDLSFVVVFIDALRADHVGAYGYKRPTTPNLDRLARRGALFERTYAPAPYTYGSIPAVMLSRPATMLSPKLLRKKGKIASRDLTLAEAMSRGGLRTAYATDGGALRKMGLYAGFQAGKMTYDNAERTTRNALALLRTFGKQRFFLWVDLLCPHHPYTTHKGAPTFGGDAIDLYDHEILFADRHLGQLLAALEKPPYRGRVVVVVFGDHGEAFGEHGTYYHGHNLHEENVRVPLVIAVPGIKGRVLRKEPVSLIDIFPTLMRLARLPIPSSVWGEDLSRALLTGEQRPGRKVIIASLFKGYGVTLDYQLAVATRSMKLIDDWGARTTKLYDLNRDPGETEDVSTREPYRFQQLNRVLKQYQAFMKR